MNVFTDAQVCDMLATRLLKEGIEKLEAKHAAPHILELIQNFVDAECKPYQEEIARLQQELAVARTEVPSQ